MLIETDGYISMVARCEMNAICLAITAISQNVILWAQGKLLQRFASSISLRSGDLEVVAGQRRPLKTIMDAPQAACLAGFFDLRRIKQSQPLIGGRLNSQAPFLKERAAKLVEPVFALAKPLEKRNRR